ncbi:MAG: response regulator [Deltaproteobacteria bacterium]|jgi:two-component system, OmpR family, phosphate regulon response regulator OmpR|nr:response regulator [Deltaproteobacteria bacterium]
MDKKVLIVDDDQKLRALLTEYLTEFGFQTATLPDGRRVLSAIKTENPHIVLLDIMLPHKDGFDILREIRTAFTVPVIMLTARGEDADRIVGLELGADDYLPKPFNPRELLARIRAVLRRSALAIKGDAGQNGNHLIEAGGLILNKAKRVVKVENEEVALSSTEFEILKVLMEHPNRTLSRDQLMNMAKGRDFMAFDRSIDVHISKLRAKVESNPRSPERIKTVWGAGYIFVDTK